MSGPYARKGVSTTMLNRRGQSTAEYAIVISVVIAAVVGMQLYVKRGLQGKTKQVMDHFTRLNEGTNGTNLLSTGGNTFTQYEPYYQDQDYVVGQNSTSQEEYQLGGSVNRTGVNEATTRTGSSRQGTNIDGDDLWAE